MNLIIQATSEITPLQIKTLSGLTGACRAEQVSPLAYRLVDAHPHDGVASYCWEERLDYAYVRPSQKLSDFGLVVMEMDSTLITTDCFDEIATMYHLKPQVLAITEAILRGEIDFPESLRRRAALLEGLEESALLQVYDERLKLNPGASLMLQKLKELGIHTLLISSGFGFFTERLKARLGFDFSHSNMLESVNGKLTGKLLGDIVDAKAKADWLVKIRDEHMTKGKQVIAMGDSAHDLKMMSQASVSIAYHAQAVVRSQASYAFNFVGLDGLNHLFAA
jgi:phosphoserine phosphatase